jgi:hypothetical protein
MNALPNAIVMPEPGQSREIKGLTESEAIALYFNSPEVESAIGHVSTADVLARRGFTGLQFNRISVSPQAGDELLVAAFTPTRRLGEGELFTEEEILSFPISYGLIKF